MTEKLAVRERRVRECCVVVARSIEELFVSEVPFVVILGVLDIEVADPAEFTVDVTVLGDFRILGDASAFHFILIERVHCFLLGELTDASAFGKLEVLVEVDLRGKKESG